MKAFVQSSHQRFHRGRIHLRPGGNGVVEFDPIETGLVSMSLNRTVEGSEGLGDDCNDEANR